jgi:hypothetical protein
LPAAAKIPSKKSCNGTHHQDHRHHHQHATGARCCGTK